jgi:hemolysin activation/secretion protein
VTSASAALLSALLVGPLIFGALSAAPAQAQDFGRVAPKVPAQPATPNVPNPPAETPASDDQTILIPRLAGIVFVGGVSALNPSGVSLDTVSSGVSAPGLPLLAGDAFASQIRPYIGRPLTRADLDAIIRLVREKYRANERPFIDVTAPPQNVQNGVIQIIVTEYRVDKVTVSGARYFSASTIEAMGDLKSGEGLTLPRFREALDDYNSNPFLTVSAVVRPGAETGTTDVDLQAQDRFPAQVYVGYDNQGVRSLGQDEWYVGGSLGNVFGLGQVLSYQYTESFTGRYVSHSLSDVVPLDPNDKLLFFGAYAIQTPDLGVFFNSVGHSGQASIRWVRELPAGSWFKENVQVGYDFKTANSNLEFLGFDILSNNIEVDQFPFIYDFNEHDKGGTTDIENTFVYSPGNMTPGNTDFELRQLVPFADATYVYDHLALTRTAFLPYGLTAIARASAQLASANLPNSEQLAAGGIGSVRGYDTNAVLGSEGVLLSGELRAPAFSPLRLMGVTTHEADQLQFGVFWDYADVLQHNAFPDVPPSNTLSSVGFNAHYNVGRFFNLQIEAGDQLLNPPDGSKRGWQVSIITAFTL